jgi:hypothetical protein
VLLSRALANIDLRGRFSESSGNVAQDSGDSVSITVLMTINLRNRFAPRIFFPGFDRRPFSLIDICALEDLLLSDSLRLKSEDGLVGQLAALGSEVLGRLCHARIDFLTLWASLIFLQCTPFHI